MSVTSIGSVTKAAAVADVLRRRIHEGRLGPGTQLLQEELAAEFGTSATPVREAFGVLEAEGLVQRRPHRGVIVTLAQEGDPWERLLTLEVRGVLEGRAIQRLIEQGDETVMERLRASVEAGRQALADDSEELAVRYSLSDFHRALSLALDSEYHTQVLQQLSARTQFYPHALSKENREHSLRYHEELLAAIVAGDQARAREVWAAHAEENAHALDAPPAQGQAGGADQPDRLAAGS
jgi:DNA-binding GntR family transcriptional regulator